MAGTMRKRKNLKLSTPLEVRRSLSRVINMVLNGDLDPKAANSIIMGCSAILGGIKTVDYEKKLQELEQLLNER